MVATGACNGTRCGVKTGTVSWHAAGNPRLSVSSTVSTDFHLALSCGVQIGVVDGMFEVVDNMFCHYFATEMRDCGMGNGLV